MTWFQPRENRWPTARCYIDGLRSRFGAVCDALFRDNVFVEYEEGVWLSDPSHRALACLCHVFKYLDGEPDIASVYLHARFLNFGPPLFELTDTQAFCLENVEPRVSVLDYKQSFPVLGVVLPSNYAARRCLTQRVGDITSSVPCHPILLLVGKIKSEIVAASFLMSDGSAVRG